MKRKGARVYLTAKQLRAMYAVINHYDEVAALVHTYAAAAHNSEPLRYPGEHEMSYSLRSAWEKIQAATQEAYPDLRG